MRRAVLETGTGILASGTHPSAREDDSAITHKERYEHIHYLLGDAAVTPVAALHIHVGMPDAETAIRAFNGLRRELPLLLALAANSPFRHRRDTGLASAREVSLREWPRSGVPRAMRNFADFCEMSSLLTRAADVPDYTYFWWKLRPHPRLGTVEIRALDAQTSLSDTAALVALVHCLARDAAETRPGRDPPPELIEEGIFRAARFGVDGKLPDAHGSPRPVSEILEDTLARLENRAHELGCVDELALLPDLVHRGGGAGTQRAIHKIAGIDVLAQQLTRLTAAQATTRRPRPSTNTNVGAESLSVRGEADSRAAPDNPSLSKVRAAACAAASSMPGSRYRSTATVAAVARPEAVAALDAWQAGCRRLEHAGPRGDRPDGG
jgi:glutamate---cysteine ligase / carboxylate-amine ligase